jgi:hypothetical protein
MFARQDYGRGISTLRLPPPSADGPNQRSPARGRGILKGASETAQVWNQSPGLCRAPRHRASAGPGRNRAQAVQEHGVPTYEHEPGLSLRPEEGGDCTRNRPMCARYRSPDASDPSCGQAKLRSPTVRRSVQASSGNELVQHPAPSRYRSLFWRTGTLRVQQLRKIGSPDREGPLLAIPPRRQGAEST